MSSTPITARTSHVGERVLEKLAAFGRPMQLCDIVRAVGCDRSHCSNLLKQYVEHGLIERTAEFGRPHFHLVGPPLNSVGPPLNSVGSPLNPMRCFFRPGAEKVMKKNEFVIFSQTRTQQSKNAPEWMIRGLRKVIPNDTRRGDQ